MIFIENFSGPAAIRAASSAIIKKTPDSQSKRKLEDNNTHYQLKKKIAPSSKGTLVDLILN